MARKLIGTPGGVEQRGGSTRLPPVHLRTVPMLPNRTLAGWIERHAWMVLLGILALALAIRLINLSGLPDTLNPDEADTSQDAIRVLYGAPRPNGFFGVDWTQQPAFSVYVMAGLLRVFGINIGAIRLAAALYSVAALVPFYLVLRRQFSAGPSLLATLLLATNLWYLNFSRSGWNNVFICLYLLMTIWCLLHALDTLADPPRRRWQRWAWWGGVGAFCALALYGYTSGRTVPVAVAAFFPIALWRYRQHWRDLIRGYLVAGIVAAIVFAPQASYIVGNWQLFNTRAGAVLLLNKPDFRVDPVGVMIDQISRNVLGFWYGAPNHTPRYTPEGEPLLDPVTGALVLLGMMLSLGGVAWRQRIETALWWIMFLVPWAITQLLTIDTPDGARGIGWMPTLLFFAALSFEAIRHLAARFPVRLGWLPAVTVLIALLAAAHNVDHYVGWQRLSATREERQPYIEPAEFDAWVGDVIAQAQAGRGSFPISEWRITHPQGWLRNPATIATPNQPNEPPWTPPTTPRDQWPRAVASFGAGALQDPRGIAVDQTGNVYVADSAASVQQIVKFDAAGKLIGRWGGLGAGNGQFANLWAVAVSAENDVYALDEATGWVQVWSSNGQWLRKIIGPEADMYHPRAMTIRGGTIYIADAGRQRVLAFALDGTLKQEWSRKRLPPGAYLGEPSGVAATDNGTLFVADASTAHIRRYAADGAPQGAWPIARAEALDGPRLALAPDGSLYATLPDDCMVVRFDQRGTPQTSGGSCDDSSYLQRPGAIAVGSNGTLYVTDLITRTVRVYAP